MTDWNKIADRLQKGISSPDDYQQAIALCERMARGELVEKSVLDEERETHNQTLTKLWRQEGELGAVRTERNGFKLELELIEVRRGQEQCLPVDEEEITHCQEVAESSFNTPDNIEYVTNLLIRERDLAHKAGWNAGYQAGREQAAEAAKHAGYEEGLKAGQKPLIAGLNKIEDIVLNSCDERLVEQVQDIIWELVP